MALLLWCLILMLVIALALGFGILLAQGAVKVLEWLYEKWMV